LTTPAPASLSSSQRPPPATEYCVSYAWGDTTQEGRERDALVDRLCDEAQARGTIILRDKDVLGLGDRISEFMKRIGRADRVFIFLSDKYLKSPFCMFELNEVWRTSKLEGETFLQRIRVYTLPCAKIWNTLDRTRYAIYWKQKHDELEALEKEHGYAIIGEIGMQTLRRMREFSHNVSDVLATAADVLHPLTFDDFIRYGLDDTGPPEGSADEPPPLPVQPADDLPGLGSPPSATALSATSSLSAPPTADQERLAAKRLAADDAELFRSALKVRFEEDLEQVMPADPSEVVRWFATCPLEQAEQALDVVHAAVLAVREDSRGPGVLMSLENAAVPLYCLAASRLVDRAVHEQAAKLSASSTLIKVPTDENVICGVIAAALFGGELRLEEAEPRGVEPSPRAKYAFVVKPANGGDLVADDFERAAFLAVTGAVRGAPAAALDTGPLDDDQMGWLRQVIHRERKLRKQCLAFVVPYFYSAEACARFASRHSVPVLIHDETAEQLLGMDVNTLKWRIIDFWRSACSGSAAAASPAASPPLRPVEEPVMRPPQQSINVYGNAAISTGAHSAAQQGSDQQAHVAHHAGVDVAAIMPLLEALIREIQATSLQNREQLVADLRAAEKAQSKGEPEPGRITQVLDAVKASADGLENGGRIISLCTKAYNLIAPALGVPPLPLP
jgi:internalin A